jgi:hypothetical protein
MGTRMLWATLSHGRFIGLEDADLNDARQRRRVEDEFVPGFRRTFHRLLGLPRRRSSDVFSGSGVFTEFTGRARRVIALAQEEARVLKHDYIGTEHILLGLIREGEGVAAKALQSMDMSLDAARQQVEDIVGPRHHVASGHIPFTARAKKVLELSLGEARQRGDDHIGTEHLLLGLVREGQGVGSQVLVRLGADLGRVRERVVDLLPRGPKSQS